MAGMGQGGYGSMIDTGVQMAQNTSKQEYNQRQALIQNLMGAMDDSEWLRQHYPNFYGWNSQGGGGGGYEAGSAAPQTYAGNPIKSDFASSMGGQNKNQDAQANYYNYLMEKDKKLGSDSGETSSGYSSLWS